MIFILEQLKKLNWPLLILVYALLFFGVYAIELGAQNTFRGGEYFANRQKIWILLGSIVLFFTAFINYHYIKIIAFPLYLCSIGFLILLLFLGNHTHQLSLFGFTFQPTQLAIASGILMNAVLIEKNLKKTSLEKILYLLFFNGIPFLLVLKNSDVGSAVIWLPVLGTALLMSGITIRYFLLFLLLFLSFVPIIYHILLPFSPRAKQRVSTYIRTTITGKIEAKRKEGYAAHWISTAIKNGGWDGKRNYKNTVHSLGLIPKETAHNDYIFSVIAEEKGFRVTSLIIFSLFAIFLLSLGISLYSKDLFGMSLVTGITTFLFSHTFENIGMSLLLLPMTGIPLPFISYSGTFTLACLFLIGIIQSVWIHRQSDMQKKHGEKYFINRRKSTQLTIQ